MKHLLLILVILTTHLAFSQDPSCEYQVTLNDVQSNLYDYEIILEDQYEKIPIDTIAKLLRNNVSLSLGYAFFKTQDGKEIILGSKSGYCYPNSEIEEQLRVIVTRKNKETEKIEIMYFTAPMLIGKTVIEIEKFQQGKREVDMYNYDRFVKETQSNKFWYNIALEATQKIIVI